MLRGCVRKPVAVLQLFLLQSTPEVPPSPPPPEESEDPPINFEKPPPEDPPTPQRNTLIFLKDVSFFAYLYDLMTSDVRKTVTIKFRPSLWIIIHRKYTVNISLMLLKTFLSQFILFLFLQLSLHFRRILRRRSRSRRRYCESSPEEEEEE